MDGFVVIAASEAISALIGALVAGVIVRLKSSARHATDEMKAIKRGLRAILRKEIVDAYQYYIVEGHKMTVERIDELEKAFEAYEGLGGNGTAKELFNVVKANRPWIVTD